MDLGGLHVGFVFVLSMYVSMSFVLFEFMRKGDVLFGDEFCSVLKQFQSIRSSHKFVLFFERLYMLRLFTYLSVS